MTLGVYHPSQADDESHERRAPANPTQNFGFFDRISQQSFLGVSLLIAHYISRGADLWDGVRSGVGQEALRTAIRSEKGL